MTEKKVISLLDDVLDNLPQEILEAEDVRKREQLILKDAEQEAGIIIEDANRKVEQLVDQDEITKLAYEKK